MRFHELVCGGLDGVMEAACRGATEANPPTRTIGILPGDDPSAANEFVDVPIATGMGSARNALAIDNARNALAIGNADVAIAMGSAVRSWRSRSRWIADFRPLP